MNKLEQEILNGAVKAQKAYQEMSGGRWLWHGPESFLQVFVAQEVAKTGHEIFIDATIKKLNAEIKRGPGRPTTDSRKRPDICVWYKGGEKLRAVIEVKRAWSLDPIRRDALKIEKYLKSKNGPTSGYLLVYSESRQLRLQSQLKKRFESWASSLNWHLCATHLNKEKDENGWNWGIVIYRNKLQR